MTYLGLGMAGLVPEELGPDGIEVMGCSRSTITPPCPLYKKKIMLLTRAVNPTNFWIGCGFGFLQKSV